MGAGGGDGSWWAAGSSGAFVAKGQKKGFFFTIYDPQRSEYGRKSGQRSAEAAAKPPPFAP